MLRADSRFAASQWETALLCNDVSHWLGASLKSALYARQRLTGFVSLDCTWMYFYHVSNAYVCVLHASCSVVSVYTHDDVIKWKHFPRYWPFVRGIHRSPVNSPHKGQWRGALMFTLICARINGWVNNGEAGDLRRYRVHYDVTVMMIHLMKCRTRLYP